MMEFLTAVIETSMGEFHDPDHFEGDMWGTDSPTVTAPSLIWMPMGFWMRKLVKLISTETA